MNCLLKLKSSVDPAQIKPEVNLAIQIALTVWDRQSEPVLTITSISDSKHSHKSRHYIGYAVDLRIRQLHNNPQVLVDGLKEALTDHYLVLLEKDHIHLGYQPTWKP